MFTYFYEIFNVPKRFQQIFSIYSNDGISHTLKISQLNDNVHIPPVIKKLRASLRRIRRWINHHSRKEVINFSFSQSKSDAHPIRHPRMASQRVPIYIDRHGFMLMPVIYCYFYLIPKIIIWTVSVWIKIVFHTPGRKQTSAVSNRVRIISFDLRRYFIMLEHHAVSTNRFMRMNLEIRILLSFILSWDWCENILVANFPFCQLVSK